MRGTALLTPPDMLSDEMVSVPLFVHWVLVCVLFVCDCVYVCVCVCMLLCLCPSAHERAMRYRLVFVRIILYEKCGVCEYVSCRFGYCVVCDGRERVCVCVCVRTIL